MNIMKEERTNGEPNDLRVRRMLLPLPKKREREEEELIRRLQR